MEPKNEAAALTPERIEKLKAHLENNAFAQICGIKVAEMRYDYVKMTAEVRPELLNPLGRVHGGMLYTLADCCSGLTARTDGRKYVTTCPTLHRGISKPKAGSSAAAVPSVCWTLRCAAPRKTSCWLKASLRCTPSDPPISSIKRQGRCFRQKQRPYLFEFC